MNKMFGIMIDCSRSAVMNVETVKNYADIVKKMGYNTIMLYTEDTYEVDNQPCFGHLRGRYSKAEMKEIDEYCYNIGIEVIPCIQTLAHLEAIFKWKEYTDINDCENILLADEEKTYKLIEDMFSTLTSCLRTKKFHIGMDEAYRVGTGKYEKLHGKKDRFDVINNHLHRIADIAKKYNVEIMVWSDMFCKLAFDIASQYDDVDTSKIKEKAQLPDNVSLVYWDYYKTEYDKYVKLINTNKLFGRKVYFAGGAWTWKGFGPDNDFSIKTTLPALKACNDCQIDGIIMTMWGDNGSECSKFAVLPSLMYAAEVNKGNINPESIKSKFKEIVGCDFDNFMLLDKFNNLGETHGSTPSKYILYNDCFLGINDFRCTEADAKFYDELFKDLQSIGDQGEYEYMFEFYRKLAKTLALKATLGVRTRKAYFSGDTVALEDIILDYEEVLKSLEEFHEAFQARWFKENKPHGFDIHDIRLGGLMQRIKSCKKRLEKFAVGEINSIPELEEPVLEKEIRRTWWPEIASPNSMSGL